MSQVTKNLLDLTQRRNFYAGDLLSSVEILRNVTETFKRASYEPSSDDVQVKLFFVCFFYSSHVKLFLNSRSVEKQVVFFFGVT